MPGLAKEFADDLRTIADELDDIDQREFVKVEHKRSDSRLLAEFLEELVSVLRNHSHARENECQS